MGLTYSATRSVLLLSDGTEACLRRRAATVVGGYRLTPEWSFQLGGGATLGGDATVDETGVIHDLAIGGVGFGGVSYQVLNGVGDLPFVSMGGTLSVSSGGAGRRVGANTDDFLTAIDGRFSVTAGKVLWSSLAPYAVFRAFGGPVIWVRDGEELAGTDKYHVQLGAGLLVAAGPLDAFFEVVPLGEQALTMGAALRL